MKYRSGFVSNSSSASYYINITGSREKINDLLAYSCEWAEYNDELRTRITENIKRLEESILENETNSQSFLFMTIEEQKQILAKNKEWLAYLNNEQRFMTPDYKEKHTNLVLETYGIKIDRQDNKTNLSYDVSMHNCYTEGMPRVFQELTLIHAFEKPEGITIEYECEHTN